MLDRNKIFIFKLQEKWLCALKKLKTKTNQEPCKTENPFKNYGNQPRSKKNMKLPWTHMETDQKRWETIKLPWKPWKQTKNHKTSLKHHRNHPKSWKLLLKTMNEIELKRKLEIFLLGGKKCENNRMKNKNDE